MVSISVDRLMGQLEQLRREKGGLARKIQELETDNTQISDISQEKKKKRIEDVEQLIRQLCCSASARSGRVNTMQDIFDTTRRSAAEVQLKAKDCVEYLNHENVRQTDLLGRYAGRSRDSMQPLLSHLLSTSFLRHKESMDRIDAERDEIRADNEALAEKVKSTSNAEEPNKDVCVAMAEANPC